nr:MAG TPA: hypothetical protein [Caudoviricetes sp.]
MPVFLFILNLCRFRTNSSIFFPIFAAIFYHRMSP